jgi:hypothetical protein
MFEYMLRVARDEGEATKARIDAYTWLADRGFGKPTQTEVRFTAEGRSLVASWPLSFASRTGCADRGCPGESSTVGPRP